MSISIYLILMLISALLIIFMALFLKKEKSGQIKFVFMSLIYFMMIWTFSLIFQILFLNSNIKAVYFEYFAGLGACFVPISILMLALIFANTRISFKKSYLLLLVIPVTSLLILWTNDIHHLFYKNYSIQLKDTIPGPYMTIHSVYTYSIFAIAIWIFLRYSIKNAGFFSKQSLLIILGALIPIAVNILGTFQIIPMTVYVTPICFAFTIVIFAFAIFKFKFLSVTPIAMQRIVDRISDGFIVINEDNIITDFNSTFITTFNLSNENIRNQNLIDFVISKKIRDINEQDIQDILEKCKHTTDTIQFKKEFNIKNQYFNIEISGIFSKNNFLGTLILFKNVTQHVIDKQIIEDNQSIIMEKERLATLGQMIGGIAHNLKTPIMSISGAVEGIRELAHEYDISIGDPTVTNEDHHEIVKDMNVWIEKIKTHLEYMSDVITAVKGQTVAFSDNRNDRFTVNELVKYVELLMRHELKNALIEMKTTVLVDTSVIINGNINSLVQVINNMISNSIQAYNGATNKRIDFIITRKDNDVIFSIQDYGCGMSKKVQDKLFKEMVTTKGKNGTGLGLFMSYSNIRAHFSGNITFETKEGEGTRFNIIIPINKDEEVQE